jgi:phosphatidylglycerol---prolipoprotein diacylglyceryl transferase
VSVVIGLLLLVRFGGGKKREAAERKEYYRMQLITLAGAIAGAKLSVVVGDYGWPMNSFTEWEALVWSGRSITGAMLGGFLAAETAKPILNYSLPPNDRFAAILPFSIGIGRIGCMATGCCGGIQCSNGLRLLSPTGDRFPNQLVEALFHFSLGALFLWFVKREIMAARLFALYLVVYGVFRFLLEPLRDTPKSYNGVSGYQLIAVLMMLAGGVFLFLRKDGYGRWNATPSA